MVYTREKYIPSQILCPHCHAMNPVHEPVCAKCLKKIHSGAKGSVWKHQFGANRLVVLMGILVCLVCVIGVQKMIKNVEMHVNNIHTQTERYQDSMTTTRRIRLEIQKSNPEANRSDNFKI